MSRAAKMRRRGIALGAASLLLVAALAAGLATGDSLRTADGTVYEARPGDDGQTILTSRDTVGRSLGGASLGGQDVILLSPDCLATADGQTGTWRQGVLGLRVALSSRTITFPVQRIPTQGTACRGRDGGRA